MMQLPDDDRLQITCSHAGDEAIQKCWLLLYSPVYSFKAIAVR